MHAKKNLISNPQQEVESNPIWQRCVYKMCINVTLNVTNPPFLAIFFQYEGPSILLLHISYLSVQ